MAAVGVLEPGESRVCQVSFAAGLAPQVFSGEVFCYARCEDAAGELQAGLPPPAWGAECDAEGQMQLQQGGGGGEMRLLQLQAGEAEGEEVVEEVIAQHPER